MAGQTEAPTIQTDFPVEVVPTATLQRHPRNYRDHPADQLAHLMESIRTHGLYRNVVTAQDGTILAGHGVVQALQGMGILTVPIKRLPLDPMDPRALKLLAGDNEISHLGEIDDRALSELLKEIKDRAPDGLVGTGYDDAMLANLVMVTRPASEIADHHEAAEWTGMPEYGFVDEPLQAVISFRSDADRTEFARLLGMQWLKSVGKTKTAWWPNKGQDDTASVRFEAAHA